MVQNNRPPYPKVAHILQKSSPYLTTTGFTGWDQIVEPELPKNALQVAPKPWNPNCPRMLYRLGRYHGTRIAQECLTGWEKTMEPELPQNALQVATKSWNPNCLRMPYTEWDRSGNPNFIWNQDYLPDLRGLRLVKTELPRLGCELCQSSRKGGVYWA